MVSSENPFFTALNKDRVKWLGPVNIMSRSGLTLESTNYMDLHSVLQISDPGLQTVSASAITAIPFHNAQIRLGIPHFLPTESCSGT